MLCNHSKRLPFALWHADTILGTHNRVKNLVSAIIATLPEFILEIARKEIIVRDRNHFY